MKTYIYNKVKTAGNSIRFVAVAAMSAFMLTSCVDTIILPDDKTVDEDFWKTKQDVSSMVNAAYAGMTSEDVVTRLIVWGGYRGDEYTRAADLSNSVTDALDEISAVNMQTTNTYAEWGSIYSVINRCNIVLERAKELVEQKRDPNYTTYDYEADRGKMLALRALCYFYLVRNYRDVPYITTAYMNSSQERSVAQSSPEYVLQQCINDLEEVAANPNTHSASACLTSDWRRVGWMSDDAVKTLLADIYLWRASVNHSAADYQRCIDYCDMVISSKEAQYKPDRNETVKKEYPLADADRMYTQLFVNQNAEESIFELQMSNNAALCKYFFKYSNNNSLEGYLKASPIFSNSSFGTSVQLPIGAGKVFATNDLRYYAGTSVSTVSEENDVAKMIGRSSVSNKTAVTRDRDRTFANFNQNYPIYRLTDVLLMKAEALVQLANDEAETDEEKTSNSQLMEQAFHMVQVVNTRAIYRENQSDSLKWATYRNYSKNDMEQLVMAERLREFCFEGKRWYDLMRYNYRHVDGVQYGRTFAEQAGEDGDLVLVSNYKPMLELATQTRTDDAAGIQAKMRNEAYLYLPIPNSDMTVNPLLRQNPVYKTSKDFEKSY